MVEYGHLSKYCNDKRELIFVESVEWSCPKDKFFLFYYLLHAQ
jgi:hypothetical protein